MSDKNEHNKIRFKFCENISKC